LFIFRSIEEYQNALSSGDSTCTEAVRYYLERIHSSTHLNAFNRVYENNALERAALLDRNRKNGLPTGRLHGVIIALKDVICFKGFPVTASSRILENFVSTYHATAVRLLLDEDAIIIGHTNCDEFAMGSSNENSAYGKVLNAQDNARVPGGSSGGSAVAVQAELCMISLGSDTGGSVRQPADFCGIIGIKPTYGSISRYGLIAYASSFDQIGIFGKNLQDVALVLEILSKSDPMDSTAAKHNGNSANKVVSLELPASHPFRIGYFREALEHQGLDPEIRDKFLDLVGKMRKDGHEVRELSFQLLDYIVPTYYVLTTAEASSNLSRYDGVRYGYRNGGENVNLSSFYKKNRSEGFGKEVKRRILLGTFVLSAGYYDAYFTKAQQVRKLLSDHTNLIFKSLDILILPVAPSTAFKIGEKMDNPISMYLADIYTVYANLTGIPGISLPLFRHTNGMRFGIQAMTNRFKELYLLQFSHHLMQQYKSYEIPTI
jgi:aspartyl-tRNA(Asn)/glutamyl-tRNA(Gln) amidotransferase subunit A